MVESGVIISTRNNLACIRVARSDKCAGCKGCLSFGEATNIIEAHNDIGASVGDVVNFEVKSRQVLGFSFLIFLFPVFSLILGYFIGMNITASDSRSGESAGIVGAMIGLAVAAIVIKVIDKFWGERHHSAVHVIGYAGIRPTYKP